MYYYAHIHLLKYDLYYHCRKCGIMLSCYKNLSFSEYCSLTSSMIITSHHCEGLLKCLRTFYVYNDYLGWIDPQCFTKHLGRFDPLDLELCKCPSLGEMPASSFLVSDGYPACCSTCGHWCKYYTISTTTVSRSYNKIKEIYSVSKDIELYYSSAPTNHRFILPRPFKRIW